MSSNAAPVLLLFGGYTEPWLDAINRIYQQSTSNLWLQSFLKDITTVIKKEAEKHPLLRDSLGGSNFTDIQEIADRFRHIDDQVGFVQCIMSYIVRAVALLGWIHDAPHALRADPRPEGIGISGGLINAAVLALGDDFGTIYDASVVAAGLLCRLCNFGGTVSSAVEERDDGASWGCAIMGMSPDQLARILTEIQDKMRIPLLKRVRVGIMGDHWATIVGTPSILEACLGHPALEQLDKQKLPIRSMQHNYDATLADLEHIAGDSPLHNRSIHSKFRLWGLCEDDKNSEPQTYGNWGQLLLAVVDSAHSKPVDLVQMVNGLTDRLNSASDSAQVTVRVMGPSWFAGSLTNKMKASGKKISAILHNVFGPDDGLETHAKTRQIQDYQGRIAIVGMAGRAPDCEDLNQYWQLIANGRDVARELPADRFDAKEFFTNNNENKHHQHKDNSNDKPNCTSTTKFGCFIDNPGLFDAHFFHVSAREALLMDPGARLYQMAAYEALDSAGYSKGNSNKIDPSRIAVFYGQSNIEAYEAVHNEKGCNAYTLQALGRPFPPSRVAFLYGWEGPTWSVDQACSTSSSVIHHACSGLLANEFDMAVAGAANILASPHGWCMLSKMGVLSDIGNCSTFRDDAQGYCRGEFVGVVVLKRLEDAIAHNDRILAVIAGSARNQSGNAKFLTAPDASAEGRCFQKALRQARLSPEDLSYIEMHGTATAIGDPVEMS